MSKQRDVRFRRAPHLMSYWDGTTLVFENFVEGTRATARPVVTELLHFFDRWRPADDLYRRLNRFDQPSLRRTLQHLVKARLLERSDHPRNPKNDAVSAWARWNPSASYFHLSTKQVSASSLDAERRRIRARTQTTRPSPVKRYRGAVSRALPRARHSGEFAEVLLARRTWRLFSKTPSALADVATILQLTFGIQRWRRISGGGRVPLKTSPSGGACHPIEVYVLARRVGGLPRGLYHYAPDRHRLEVLSPEKTPTIASYLPLQSWFHDAAALIVMTAVFPRKQWKYEAPRAYRSVLLEAGHFCQTFCLVATWLGLAPFCTAALDESRIERDIGADGVTESVIYAAGVGSRRSI